MFFLVRRDPIRSAICTCCSHDKLENVTIYCILSKILVKVHPTINEDLKIYLKTGKGTRLTVPLNIPILKKIIVFLIHFTE
jgi:hypothetical protein